jgi:hypothetical protein
VDRYGPPLTSSRAASGIRRRTSGGARISVSWPLRGTSRDTHTITGRSTRPCRIRTASPEASNANASVSTPGASCSNVVSSPIARSNRVRKYSPR